VVCNAMQVEPKMSGLGCRWTRWGSAQIGFVIPRIY
jgi:hypothetical protein